MANTTKHQDIQWYHRRQKKSNKIFYTQPIQNIPPESNLSSLSYLIFTLIYSISVCLISHYSKLIAGKLEGKRGISRGRKATNLGNKQCFSQGWCGAVMNTIASLSSIRPQPVSLWDGPPSNTPRPSLEGPQKGLSRDLRASLLPPSSTWQLSPLSCSPFGDEALPQWRC